MKNYGFIQPKIDETHYVFGSGALGGVVLQENGQWDAFLPAVELQYETDFDSYNCTGYGTTNCFETLLNRLKIEKNFSDRYLGVCAGTQPPGNDPHVVAQAVRHSGLIEEKYLPFDKELLTSWQEYFSYKGGDEKTCEIEGQKFLTKFSVGHDWVLVGGETKEARLAKMKAGLLSSPLGASVSAWFLEDGLYVDKDIPNNHWVMIYGYNEQGWKVFDSYDQTHKIVSYDHKIQFAKRYTITAKKKVNWLADLINRFFALFNTDFRMEK